MSNPSEIIPITSDMLRKIGDLLNTVSITFGPRGKCIVIEDSMGDVMLTQDGAKAIKHLKTHIPGNSHLLAILKKPILSIANQVGDGTTTTALLISIGICKLSQFIGSDNRLYDILQGMDTAANESVKIIQNKLVTPLSYEDYNMISNVASISSKDKTLGKLVADAYKEIKGYGLVQVMKSQSTQTYLKSSSGFSFNSGYLFADKGKQFIELKNCLILLYTGQITSLVDLQHLSNLLQEIIDGGKSLLIIADDISGVALGTLMIHSARGSIKISCVKAPSWGSARRDIMEDIAIMTGGKVIEDKTTSLKEITMKDLGSAELVKSYANETIITEGGGIPEEIEKHKEDLKSITGASEYEKKNLEKRIAAFEGGICSIMIGGLTENEQNEKYDLVEDAVAAVKSALKCGICSGGGITLLKLHNLLKSVLEQSSGNMNFKLGIQLFMETIKDLILTLLSNTGSENSSEALFSELKKAHEQNEGDYGFDALSGQFVNSMKENGIVDAAEVLLTAIPLAISTIKNIVASKYVFSSLEKKEDQDFMA